MANLVTAQARSFAARLLGCDVDALRVEAVSGGFSRNRKSLVGAGDRWIFVKEVDVSLLPDDGAEELRWLRKEHEVMTHLAEAAPGVAPPWCELGDDGSVLAMTALRADDGWLWGYPAQPVQHRAYVAAVIDTLAALDGVDFTADEIERLELTAHFAQDLAHDEGFTTLLASSEVRSAAHAMLVGARSVHLSRAIDAAVALIADPAALAGLAAEAATLAQQPSDTFGHCDVRADNLAYHPGTGQVCLIDWNWSSMVPQRDCSTEFLVDAARSGVDVSAWRASLNRPLLAALVGFWLWRCTHEPLAPGNSLRAVQAESAAVAYDLYRMLAS